MRRARHRPPSRLRWIQDHPTVGIHLTRAEHERLTEIRERTGASFAALLRAAVLDEDTDLERIRLQAFENGVAEGLRRGQAAGYAAAKQAYGLTYLCSQCEQPILLRAGSRSAEAATEALELRGWHHRSCGWDHGLQ